MRKTVTDVDRHLARRLRQRRMELNLTQEMVGAVCGVGLQQAQRYETAGTPITAAKLWQIAILLGVPIGYFFEGLQRTVLACRWRDDVRGERLADG